MDVGILAIGTFLPDEVRTNEWWPSEVVDVWKAQAERSIARKVSAPEPESEAEREVLAAVVDTLGDPFRGAKERRVMDAHATSADMEIEAAKRAIGAAGLQPSEIDLVLTNTAIPDELGANGACTIQSALGVPRRSFALSVEASCNSFLMQLELAHSMIKAGSARHGLLIQSSASSRVLPYDAQYSAWFGDGATAVLVGPVPSGDGLQSSCHLSEGSLQDTLVAGVPGSRWYEDGRVILYPKEMERAQVMFRKTADHAAEAIGGALDRAGIAKRDIDFYASHQGTGWLGRVTQSVAGLSHARSLNTFSRFGSVFACNVPLVLATAAQEGTLRKDDVVAAFSGGIGITFSSAVFRWKGHERGLL